MRETTRAAVMTALTCLAIVLAIGAAMVAQGNAEAREIEPDWTWKVYPTDRTNTEALWGMRMREISEFVDSIISQYEEEKAAEQAALEAEQEAYYEPYYYEPVYYAPTYSGVQGDPDGLNSFVGVVDGPNGTIETAYSSNVLYHYRTSEWAPDEYGFYRTDEGYYVVASSDYEQGTVIETSRGEAMVLDTGCDNKVVDFYVNW